MSNSDRQEERKKGREGGLSRKQKRAEYIGMLYITRSDLQDLQTYKKGKN